MCRNCMGTCVVVEACCDPVCRREGSQAKQVSTAYICTTCNVCGPKPIYSHRGPARHTSMWLCSLGILCVQLIDLSDYRCIVAMTYNEAPSPPWAPNCHGDDSGE